jgi:PTH1 family peptidyl-tRNA hydrolase
MKLVVGLGNPGKKYDKTRHNVGFAVVNRLAERWGIARLTKKQFGSFVADGQVSNKKCLLALPQSYMNRSGQPVASLMGYFKLTPQDVIVIHDELAMDYGVVRCKLGGGHGGHNGLRDIIQHIGKDFLRVRMGIGRPPQGWDQANYVLSRWSSIESSTTDEYLERGTAAIESILTDGIVQSMNVFNVRNTPPNQQPVDGL